MKEKCIKKLKEWFGGCDFEYEIVKGTEDEYIFAVISDDSGERMVSLYRIFWLVDNLEISRDYEQSISGDEHSILSAIAELLRVYARVSV